MTDAVFALRTGTSTVERSLRAYLDTAAEERATRDALKWIKRLRHARVDGEPLRRRFTCRDDSLWWFAELYLHKQRVIDDIFQTLTALGAMLEAESPAEIRLVRGQNALIGLQWLEMTRYLALFEMVGE